MLSNVYFSQLGNNNNEHIKLTIYAVLCVLFFGREILIIDSVIKQLNKEYDARKKIIDQQTSKESYGLSLQQEQLKYQQAIANGDQQGAAQAQVNMRQLNLEYQKTQALAALEDKHNADLIKQEDARAAVADKLAAPASSIIS